MRGDTTEACLAAISLSVCSSQCSPDVSLIKALIEIGESVNAEGTPQVSHRISKQSLYKSPVQTLTRSWKLPLKRPVLSKFFLIGVTWLQAVLKNLHPF